MRRCRWFKRRWLDRTLDWLLPTDCFACGEPLGSRQWLGACLGCWTAMTPIEQPCSGCGLPRPMTTDLLGPRRRGRCAACLTGRPLCDRVHVAVAYDQPARAVLLRAKLQGRVELLEGLGRRLARAAELGGWPGDATMIVPVPSHAWATLKRGFNPATVLARAIARRTGLEFAPRVLGRRLRAPTTSRRSPVRARRRAAERAIVGRRRIDGHHVLLVDDVITTGATVTACTDVLRRNGAASVAVVAWARVLPWSIMPP